MEDRESLVNVITEELRCCSDLGYGFRRTAENVIAIVEGSRKHMDYDSESKQYEWEEKPQCHT